MIGYLPMDFQNQALVSDLYELTMLQAYTGLDMDQEAVFSLFVRKLPQNRNYLLACGLDDILDLVQDMRFSSSALAYLKSLKLFQPEFLDWLREFRFTGSIFALEEGTPIFSQEPILEVAAPIGQAQLLETLILNQIHLQTMIASKASRVVAAARDRRVVDFGLRRMHGIDAGLKAARAMYIAGIQATSNVHAGYTYSLPLSGTMAHSFIQAHEKERQAFRDFCRFFPESVLLVDTYDTLQGVQEVINLAQDLGPDFKVRGIRLDSGDLVRLAFQSRQMLDSAGLQDLHIFASGSLDEYKIKDILFQGAPIDGFGVGTQMGISQDAPYLDMVYKLTSYAGEGRLKKSTGKKTLPWQKQIFRQSNENGYSQDILATWQESYPGEPLLRQVMQGGSRLEPKRSLDELRERTRAKISLLPTKLQDLDPARQEYPIQISDFLHSEQKRLQQMEHSPA
ncbi:MAG: nicotinate phosphoribosyltransferase [Desulfohalobiaceae bacterium]